MNMDVAIIGAGPAGLIAAEVLATNGMKVCIFDRKATPARKFLLAGRGGLNLTHSEPLEQFVSRYREGRIFLEPMIKSFTPAHLRAWCEELGQETFVGSSGRIFPKTMKASPLLRAWLARLEKLGVVFRMEHDWQGWNEKTELVFVTKGKTETFKPDATLLALGGASWPNLGSDGSWAPLLAASGIDIAELRAANCGFICSWSDFFKERHAGQPLKSIALTINDQTAKGEIMIDVNGIEGGAVYALSAPIREEILRKGHAAVKIDLRPEMTAESIRSKLQIPRGRKSFSTWIDKTLHLSSLQTALMRDAEPDLSGLAADQLAALIKSIPINLTGIFPIDRAISTAGGVEASSLDKNLMFRSIPGLFAAGEMLDWEAPTGGYLLQGCFATGMTAAKGILAWLSPR